MTTVRAEHGREVVGTPLMDADALLPDRASWLSRNRWKLGLALVAVIGGVCYSRFRRSHSIEVGSVSEGWLAEQAFQAGQRPPE